MRTPVEAVSLTLATFGLVLWGGMEAMSRPVVRVSAYPRVAHVPADVRLTARVLDPGQQLSCPTFAWSWGEGEGGGSWTPDCDAYGFPEERPRLWAGGPLSPKAHTYRRPGEYEITVTVTAGDRTMSATQRVVIAGPGLFADGGK